jgi:hypothetical protein
VTALKLVIGHLLEHLTLLEMQQVSARKEQREIAIKKSSGTYIEPRQASANEKQLRDYETSIAEAQELLIHLQGRLIK